MDEENLGMDLNSWKGVIMFLVLLIGFLTFGYAVGWVKINSNDLKLYTAMFSTIGTLLLVLATLETVKQNQNLINQERRSNKREEIKSKILQGELSENIDNLEELKRKTIDKRIPEIDDQIKTGYSHEITEITGIEIEDKIKILKSRIEYYQTERKKLKENLVNFLIDQRSFPVFNNKKTAREKVEKFLIGFNKDDSLKIKLNQKTGELYGRDEVERLKTIKTSILTEAEYLLDYFDNAESGIGEKYGIPIEKEKEINLDEWESF